MKRHLRTQLDLIQPNLEDRVRDKQSQQNSAHDHHARDRVIKTGDLVYAKDFRNPKAWIPGTVVKKTGPVSAEVQLEDGQIIRRHQDHLRIRTAVTQETTTDALEDTQLPTMEANLAGNLDEPEAPAVEERIQPRRQPQRNRHLPQHLQDYELADSYVEHVTVYEQLLNMTFKLKFYCVS